MPCDYSADGVSVPFARLDAATPFILYLQCPNLSTAIFALLSAREQQLFSAVFAPERRWALSLGTKKNGSWRFLNTDNTHLPGCSTPGKYMKKAQEEVTFLLNRQRKFGKMSQATDHPQLITHPEPRGELWE